MARFMEGPRQFANEREASEACLLRLIIQVLILSVSIYYAVMERELPGRAFSDRPTQLETALSRITP